MAFGMIELGRLPLEAQEEILSRLSSEDTCPIEIDSEVYYIPNAVSDLIDYLYKQVYSFKKGENGIPQNKK